MTNGHPHNMHLLNWKNQMFHISSFKSGDAALTPLTHKDKS